MADSSDEIWATSHVDEAPPAAALPNMVLPAIFASQPNLAQLQQRPEAEETLNQVLSILRTALPSGDHTSDSLRVLGESYAAWMLERFVVSDSLWFQLAEIGVWLAVHGNSSPIDQLKASNLCPTAFPHEEAFCDYQRQVAFVCGLFDAVCRPAVANPTASSQAVDVFISWMERAMAKYEFVFLHHVAEPLVHHIQQKHRVLPQSIARAAQAVVDQGLRKNWQQRLAAIAVAAILLSASTETASLRSLQVLVDQQLRGEDAFPHLHRPTAVLAVSLRAAPLAVTPSPLIHQFILFRVLSLALVSPRLLIQQHELKALSERFQEALYHARPSDSDAALTLRMMDVCTAEIKTSVRATPAVYGSVLQAMRSRNDTEIFRPSLIALAEGQEPSTEAVFPVQQFFAGVYDAVAAGIQAWLQPSSSNELVVRSFATLVRLEFMRECCGTPQRNDAIILLTQRVETLVDASPDATLAALASIVLTRDQTPDSQAVDVAFGWTCLVIGQLVQRKLRVVLFQVSETVRRDALAVVFAGLYHGLEPLNGFVHRFLGFALSSLGQFISVYEIFPYYVQESLRQFPGEVSKDQVASVLGTVFGALYYTDASTPSTVEEKALAATAAETRHAMIMWALRRTRTRVEELLSTHDTQDGLYLAELFFEVAKMAPVELLPTVAQEMETLVQFASDSANEKLLEELKTRAFNAVALNCEAEKRAWLAAWYIELDAQYPTTPAAPEDSDAGVESQQVQPSTPSSAPVASRL